jgi:hypothetical protein
MAEMRASDSHLKSRNRITRAATDGITSALSECRIASVSRLIAIMDLGPSQHGCGPWLMPKLRFPAYEAPILS